MTVTVWEEDRDSVTVKIALVVPALLSVTLTSLMARVGGSTGTISSPLTAKYRLAQSSEALLRICRLCASVRMHCQGMTVEEATRFFVVNSYYEEKPARSEARRGTHDPGYCFYTLGKLQVLKLRRDYQMLRN